MKHAPLWILVGILAVTMGADSLIDYVCAGNGAEIATFVGVSLSVIVGTFAVGVGEVRAS